LYTFSWDICSINYAILNQLNTVMLGGKKSKNIYSVHVSNNAIKICYKNSRVHFSSLVQMLI
jgi:hypothetical protein